MGINKILQVSEKIFYAKKYSDVKLDNIANELKIKKPTLYYYFKNKKEIFTETLKYSMKKYLKELDKIINKNDLNIFIRWYLTYSSINKNLFGIAFQKEYCIDQSVKYIIIRGKEQIFTKIQYFLEQYNISEIKAYLIINLLEKLSQTNCIDTYCLAYNLDDLTKETIGLIIECGKSPSL